MLFSERAVMLATHVGAIVGVVAAFVRTDFGPPSWSTTSLSMAPWGASSQRPYHRQEFPPFSPQPHCTAELGLLTQLQHLDLGINDLFTGRIPTELDRLSLLTFLDMTRSSTALGLFSNNLQSLLLENSDVNGPIPTELGLLSELTYLRLSYSELTGTIPTELGQLSMLQILTLEDSLVAGEISFEIFRLASLNSGRWDTQIYIHCDLLICRCNCTCR